MGWHFLDEIRLVLSWLAVICARCLGTCRLLDLIRRLQCARTNPQQMRRISTTNALKQWASRRHYALQEVLGELSKLRRVLVRCVGGKRLSIINQPSLQLMEHEAMSLNWFQTPTFVSVPVAGVSSLWTSLRCSLWQLSAFANSTSIFVVFMLLSVYRSLGAAKRRLRFSADTCSSTSFHSSFCDEHVRL